MRGEHQLGHSGGGAGGHDRDYAITILEDACAAADANEHHASLRMLGRIAEVCKVAQLA